MSDTPDVGRRGGGFWTTLPGLLTAVAGLLTALTALIGILYQAHIIGPKEPQGGDPPVIKRGKEDPPPAPASKLQATADDVTYAVLSAQRTPYSPREYLLTLDMKVSCKENSVNVWEDLFRLDVDGVKYAPHGGRSNHWIEQHSDWREPVKFLVSNDSRALNLIVGKVDSDRTATIPLTKSVSTPK